ncbi:RDD family protein [Flagellatimonas centrodinii]|uniref:RDD family protein n=1 Tax=Flagellatimonas centrodinii TaxID=2806210 RepID=UPI001FF76958|nr:RDD family protein [Flagellatimonas centrodinii]ULQ45729.1 RDD family protein [Flagellatimonas centrodinii]
MSATALPAPLWRRLLASVYDGLLLLAMWMSALLVEVLITDAIGVQRAPEMTRLVLLSLAFGFFGWFWTHGGQTLGGRAWRLQVQRSDGEPLRLPDAMLRFAASVTWLPLGMIWCLFDREHRALHDRIAGTRVVVLPKT